MPVTIASARTARRRRARSRLAAEDGMTIVEVIVTALMVGLISLTLVGLDAAGKATADQRRRAQAFGVAQADQERIKGLSGDQLANLNQTRTVTLDGIAYSVTSAGQFLSQSAGVGQLLELGGGGRLREDLLDRRLDGQQPPPDRRPERRHPAGGRLAAGQGARPERRRSAGRADQRRRGAAEQLGGPALREHRRGRLHDLQRAPGRRLHGHARRSPDTSTRTATPRPTSR